jgi:hypothetical protein
MTARTIDPMDVFNRGLKDPDSLPEEELIVYLLMELETLADMEGWDHFFMILFAKNVVDRRTVAWRTGHRGPP